MRPHRPIQCNTTVTMYRAHWRIGKGTLGLQRDIAKETRIVASVTAPTSSPTAIVLVELWRPTHTSIRNVDVRPIEYQHIGTAKGHHITDRISWTHIHCIRTNVRSSKPTTPSSKIGVIRIVLSQNGYGTGRAFLFVLPFLLGVRQKTENNFELAHCRRISPN